MSTEKVREAIRESEDEKTKILEPILKVFLRLVWWIFSPRRLSQWEKEEVRNNTEIYYRSRFPKPNPTILGWKTSIYYGMNVLLRKILKQIILLAIILVFYILL